MKLRKALFIGIIAVWALCLFPNKTKADGLEFATTELELLQEGDIPSTNESSNEEEESIFYVKHYASISSETKQSVRDVVVQGIKNFDKKIDLRSYSLLEQEGLELVQNIINSNPSLFYVSNGVSYYRTYVDGVAYLQYIIPKYKYTQEEVEEMTTIYEHEVSWFTDQIDDSWSDDIKVIRAHDLIVARMCYDSTYSIYDSYTLVTQNTGVCQAYSLLLKEILDRVGVENDIVTSEDMNHAWNVVLTDSGWYYVDATWDDYTDQAFGKVCHDRIFFNDTEEDYSGGVTLTNEITVSEEDFPNRQFLKKITSQIIPYDGYYYYGTQYGITKTTNFFDYYATETYPLSVTRKPWYFKSTYSSANYYQGYGCFLRDDKLYVNNTTSVYCYDLITDESYIVYTTTEEDVQICGTSDMPDGDYISLQKGVYSGSEPVKVQFMHGSEIKSVSLNINEDLKMRVKITGQDDMLTMKAEVCGKTWQYENPQLNSDGYLVFEVNVYPQYIRSEYRLSLYDGEDCIAWVDYSVLVYCNNTYAKYSDNEELSTLLADILEYGAAAEQYKDIINVKELPDWVEENASEYETLTDDKVYYKDASQSYAIKSASLDLAEKIYIRYGVVSGDGYKCVLKKDDTVVSEDLSAFAEQNGVKYYKAPAIALCNIFDAYTLELYDADGTLVSSLKYDVQAYVAGKQESDDTELVELIKAMWKCCKTASEYGK